MNDFVRFSARVSTTLFYVGLGELGNTLSKLSAQMLLYGSGYSLADSLNPLTSISKLRLTELTASRLASHSDSQIRFALIRNPYLPTPVVNQLAADTSESVVVAAAKHAHIGVRGLVNILSGKRRHPIYILIENQSARVFESAQATLALLGNVTAHHSAAHQPTCPPQLLDVLAKCSSDPLVLKAIARNTQSFTGTLNWLAANHLDVVAGELSRNSSYPLRARTVATIQHNAQTR